MRFSEWLKIDEARFKGFFKQYRRDNPNVPDYVVKQMYVNHLSPGMNRTIGKKDVDLASLPSQILNNKSLITGITWSKKPQLVTISPLSFSDDTLSTFRIWKFGMNPNDKLVKNDTNRFNIQGIKAAAAKEGENEPVIMVWDNGKFKLIEGFHRVMTYLLSAHDPNSGAPSEDIQYLRSGGNPDQLDLSRWKPVRIKAYLGNRPTQLIAQKTYDISDPETTMLWAK